MHPLLQVSIVVTAFFGNALVIVLFMLRPSRQAKRIFDLTRDQRHLLRGAAERIGLAEPAACSLYRTQLGLHDNDEVEGTIPGCRPALPGRC